MSGVNKRLFMKDKVSGKIQQEVETLTVEERQQAIAIVEKLLYFR